MYCDQNQQCKPCAYVSNSAFTGHLRDNWHTLNAYLFIVYSYMYYSIVRKKIWRFLSAPFYIWLRSSRMGEYSFFTLLQVVYVCVCVCVYCVCHSLDLTVNRLKIPFQFICMFFFSINSFDIDLKKKHNNYKWYYSWKKKWGKTEASTEENWGSKMKNWIENITKNERNELSLSRVERTIIRKRKFDF